MAHAHMGVTYLKVCCVRSEAVCEADEAQAGLFDNLLIRVLDNVLEVGQDILHHCDAVVLHASAAIGRRLHGSPLHIC